MEEPLLGMSMALNLQKRLGMTIVRGDYDNKPFPNEAQLSTAVGTSRTVIREAIKMLTAKGLIRSRQKTGTHVEPVSEWNLLDPDVLSWLMARPYSKDIYREFNEVRQAIEPKAAALAARCRDSLLIEHIHAALEAMKQHRSENEALIQADIAFHVAILKASGNPFFWRLKPLIYAALSPSIEVSNAVGGVDIPMHEAVYTCIVRGDTIEAEQAMLRLVTRSGELIEQYDLPTPEDSLQSRALPQG